MAKATLGYYVTDENRRGMEWIANGTGGANFYYGNSVTLFASRGKAKTKIRIALTSEDFTYKIERLTEPAN